jgi:NAD(P)-dependent dehydrogenase (short-subunit alcohol dehydrogenase family)
MRFNPPFTDWHGKSVWLVGASSGIGEATAAALHAAGARVFVSARNTAALDRFVDAHPGAVAVPLDAADPAAVKAAADSVLQAGPVDLLMYCAGYYKPVRADDYDLSEMLKHQQINYLGALYVLDAMLPHFLQRQAGHISLVSSVAGYRGLPKSLAYGPTKAALINLAEALYIDLQASRIGVSVINPGFVKTPATAQNDFSMPGLLTTAEAAAEILAGWRQGAFEIHFPKRFTLWMKTLRILPYAAYFAVAKRLVKNQAETPKASQNGPYN